MPTNTFKNLPQNKKDSLFEAARKEFSRVPYSQASINRMIQEAGISRGSFYTYFEDKQDLAMSVLEEYSTQLMNQTKLVMSRTNGDIFAMFIEIFDFTVEYSSIRDDIAMFRNLFINLQTNESIFKPDPSMFHRHMKDMHGYISQIDKSNLRISDDDDLRDLMELLMGVLKTSIMHVPSDACRLPQARKRFINKINMIKHGVLKERNQTR